MLNNRIQFFEINTGLKLFRCQIEINKRIKMNYILKVLNKISNTFDVTAEMLRQRANFVAMFFYLSKGPFQPKIKSLVNEK
jgi:hypothetical protein